MDFYFTGILKTREQAKFNSRENESMHSSKQTNKHNFKILHKF
jgi:hypothetical protein